MCAVPSRLVESPAVREPGDADPAAATPAAPSEGGSPMDVAARAHLAWFVGDAAGARARLTAVLPHLTGVRVTLLTVGPAGPTPPAVDAVVELPWAGDADGSEHGRRSRSRLRVWFAVDRPDLLVIDGGPDVAAAARAVGIATVNIRRPGVASRACGPVLEPLGAGELAPYPGVLEPGGGPRWSRERTVHAGLLSRFAGRRPHRRAGRRALSIPAEARVVTVLCGRDGLGGGADLAAAAAATPSWTWITVGRCGSPSTGLPSNLHRLGWRDDPWPALEAADVVVGSGALSVAAEVASARRPFIVVPRPDREDDVVHGRLLAEIGAATTLPSWPEAEAWERLLGAAAGGDPGPLADLDDGRGPARAADWLTAWATSPPLGAPAGRVAAPLGPSLRQAAYPRLIDLTRSPAHVGTSRR